MTLKMLTTIATVGAALVFGVPTAWGGDEPLRDHGDATQAKLDAQSSTDFVVVRDHGDASQAKLDSQSSTPVVIYRDHGDATQAKLLQQERIRLEGRPTGTTSRVQVSSVDSGSAIEWPQLAAGLGIGILLALGLGLIMRARNVRPFAHR